MNGAFPCKILYFFIVFAQKNLKIIINTNYVFVRRFIGKAAEVIFENVWHEYNKSVYCCRCAFLSHFLLFVCNFGMKLNNKFVS